MEQHEVIEQARAFFDSIEAIDLRRERWNSSISLRLKSNLHDLKDKINGQQYKKYTLEVLNKSILGSLNSVMLNIAQNTRRITLLNESTEDLKIAGGKLIFGQTFNGKVAVFIHYPYVTNFTKKGQQMMIGKFEPDELTDEKINDFSYQFLVEMSKWFSDDFDQERVVGFQLTSGEE